MAGYSSTPLPKKLGIKEGSRVLALHAPPEFSLDLPAGAQLRTRARTGEFDVILLFVRDTRTLQAKFDTAAARMTESAGFWIAWPKRASGVATDLTEDVVRDLALDAGLVDNKVCAIDDTWSGLRIVKRLKDRKS
jgi:hypothetical protein